MEDNTNVQVVTGPTQETQIVTEQTPTTETNDIQAKLDKLKSENEKLIRENAEKRKKLKEFESQHEATLAEQGQFKELYEKTNQRLSDLESEHISVKERAEKYDKIVAEKRKALLDSAPDELKKDLEDLPNEKIEKILSVIPKTQSVNTIGNNKTVPNHVAGATPPVVITNPYERYADVLSAMPKRK